MKTQAAPDRQASSRLVTITASTPDVARTRLTSSAIDPALKSGIRPLIRRATATGRRAEQRSLMQVGNRRALAAIQTEPEGAHDVGVMLNDGATALLWLSQP